VHNGGYSKRQAPFEWGALRYNRGLFAKQFAPPTTFLRKS
jgi:hypothetical protein